MIPDSFPRSIRESILVLIALSGTTRSVRVECSWWVDAETVKVNIRWERSSKMYSVCEEFKLYSVDA